MECEQLLECVFFKEYDKDEDKKVAMTGFKRMYCQGEKPLQCARKKVSTVLGGVHKVPVNMMPSGGPVSGTDTSNWTQEVLDCLKK